MSDTTDKLMGGAKEAIGKATGNEELEAKGRLQHDTAQFKQKTGDVADAVAEKVRGAVSDDRRS